MLERPEDAIVALDGVRLLRPDRIRDSRGHLTTLPDSVTASTRQINHSYTRAGALRGMHYHRAQTDYWYLLEGTAKVVLVDLRAPERRRVASFTWDEGDPVVLVIPPLVAHGYFAVTNVQLLYLVTQRYDGSDEFGFKWDDPSIKDRWPTQQPILSRRDSTSGFLE